MNTSMAAATMLAALAIMPACGSSSTSPGTPGESPTCSVTITGGPTAGTYDCKPATTAWSSANNAGGFGFNVSASGIAVAIGWTGEPAGGAHYKNTDTGATGGVTLTTGSGASTQVWAATAPNGGTGAQGTYDLYFSGVSGSFSTAQGKAYTTDGTLAATLIPLTGQSGNVTVSVTF
jgi:hypothetical protein